MMKYKSMAEKITVIMATNGTPRDYLCEAIDSILGQTYRNIEFVIVCDGSKEDYEFICSNYADNRIKLLLNKKNRGLPSSLNIAIAESTGKYIARMDSDDISLPNRLEKQLAFLKEKDLDVCGASAVVIGDGRGKRNLFFNSVEALRVQCLFTSVMVHPTVFGKRDVFFKNMYNESFKYSQDFELWSRIIDDYRIGNCPGCLLKYRAHNKQASVQKKEEQCRLSRIIIKNNSSKITKEYDEKVFKCLWLLSGREKINKANCVEFSKLIDYVIRQNNRFGNYDSGVLKKVLYNRFFEMVIKNKSVVKNLSVLRKVIKLYNVADLFHYVIGKI